MDAVPVPDAACVDDAASSADSVSVRVEGFRAWLAGVDVAGMSDAKRVGLIRALEGVKGPVCAAQARATDALRCSQEQARPQDSARSVGSQVALARREAPSLGDRFVGLSRALVHEMPHTMTALTTGLIAERHALAMVAATACLSVGDRAEVDRRLAPVLGSLGVQGVTRAAGRVAAELDAASVVRRMEAAVRSRRVTTRPAPDGMAYLTVLGPLTDVVGAYASLQARAKSVVGGQCPDETPDGRGVGAVMADTALRLLSGRATGQTQPVEVHLVITDMALFGVGDPKRSVNEPARIPGHGPVPAPVARAWLREGLHDPADNPDRTHDPERAGTPDSSDAADRAAPAAVWLRRLFSSPDGRDLVAMDSTRRVFTGLLRRMLILRDDVCTTPWCEAPIVHADHVHPARDGGPTSFANGNGACARCNHVKEAPGWHVEVLHTGLTPDHRPRETRWTTPTGHTPHSHPPPLTGWGWQPAPHPTPGRVHRTATQPDDQDRTTAGGRRSRVRRRPRASPLERAHINRLASA